LIITVEFVRRIAIMIGQGKAKPGCPPPPAAPIPKTKALKIEKIIIRIIGFTVFNIQDNIFTPRIPSRI